MATVFALSVKYVQFYDTETPVNWVKSFLINVNGEEVEINILDVKNLADVAQRITTTLSGRSIDVIPQDGVILLVPKKGTLSTIGPSRSLNYTYITSKYVKESKIDADLNTPYSNGISSDDMVFRIDTTSYTFPELTPPSPPADILGDVIAVESTQTSQTSQNNVLVLRLLDGSSTGFSSGSVCSLEQVRFSLSTGDELVIPITEQGDLLAGVKSSFNSTGYSVWYESNVPDFRSPLNFGVAIEFPPGISLTSSVVYSGDRSTTGSWSGDHVVTSKIASPTTTQHESGNTLIGGRGDGIVVDGTVTNTVTRNVGKTAIIGVRSPRTRYIIQIGSEMSAGPASAKILQAKANASIPSIMQFKADTAKIEKDIVDKGLTGDAAEKLRKTSKLNKLISKNNIVGRDAEKLIGISKKVLPIAAGMALLLPKFEDHQKGKDGKKLEPSAEDKEKVISDWDKLNDGNPAAIRDAQEKEITDKITAAKNAELFIGTEGDDADIDVTDLTEPSIAVIETDNIPTTTSGTEGFDDFGNDISAQKIDDYCNTNLKDIEDAAKIAKAKEDAIKIVNEGLKKAEKVVIESIDAAIEPIKTQIEAAKATYNTLIDFAAGLSVPAIPTTDQLIEKTKNSIKKKIDTIQKKIEDLEVEIEKKRIEADRLTLEAENRKAYCESMGYIEPTPKDPNTFDPQNPGA